MAEVIGDVSGLIANVTDVIDVFVLLEAYIAFATPLANKDRPKTAQRAAFYNI